MTRIQSYIRTLTSCGTRLTGYEGCDKAAAFIFETLSDFGLNPKYEYFNVTVPIDHGASLEIYSESGGLLYNLTVHPLRPNLVETCATAPGGIEGRLFYVGTGQLSDFSGKDIEGSIVLMDFDSQSNWINAAKLGAKAVVFLEPDECSSIESSQKYLDVPLDFPRLFLPKENDSDLFSLVHQNVTYAKVNLNMEFEDIRAKNIIGYVNGTDLELSSEVIIISAYYDSYSVAPSLAPGAQESIGISVLLEIAKFFGEHPPKRTVLLLALSGHHQGLAGIRSFVNSHLPHVGSKYKLLINLDLSTENDVVGVFYWGYFYVFPKVIARFEVVKRIFNTYLPDIQQQLGKSLKIENCLLQSLTRGTMYAKYMFDSEPFTLAGGIGVTYATTRTLKYHQNTPDDNMDHLHFDNLEPQAEAAICTISAFSNDEDLEFPDISSFKYDERMGGFASLKGQVVEYDYATGWYEPVPNALVYIQGYPVWPPAAGRDMYGNNLPLHGHEFLVRSDSQGYFVVHGVAPRSVYSNPVGDFNYIVEGYIDDPSYGSIDYAPDFGKYAIFPKTILILKSEEFATAVVFKCGTVALYDLLNPSSLSPLRGSYFEINDFAAHFALDHFGYAMRTYTEIPSPVKMLFVPPDKRFEVTIRTTERIYPAGWLTNATEMSPLGSGLQVGLGECLHLTPLQIANDMYWLNEERLGICLRHGVTLPSIESERIQSYQNLLNAFGAKDETNYGAFYDYAFAVWTNEFSSYADIRTLIQDSSDTIVFFTVMLIPFSVLLERLLFEYRSTLKRSVATGSIFILFLLVLNLSHPGFKVSTNAALVLMGFTIAGLISPALIMMFWKSWDYAKEFRVAFLGKHFSEISRASAVLLSFSMGISNMRRRKLRAALAILSLTLIAFALVSLSSFPALVVPEMEEFPGRTEYNGVMIREPAYIPLGNEAISIINETVHDFNATLIPRAFLGGSKILFGSQGKNYTIEGILGLMPKEPVKIQRAILGTWFISPEEYLCVIPSSAAFDLNVTVGDRIGLSNISLMVCGIFDEGILDEIVDLDQQPLIPILGGEGIGGAGAGGGRPRLELVIIVPHRLAIHLGAQTHTLAARLPDPTHVHELAQSLSSRFIELVVYAGEITDPQEEVGKIAMLQMARKTLIFGVAHLTAPFIMVVLSILNLMLGMVHERVKEIGIYSSIGLSPLHIVGMFLSQAILYSVLSSVLGYSIGILSIGITKALGIEAGFVPNYSSSMVINATVLTIVAILASSVYPLYKASKIVTPSLERKWKMPTKPKGNKWHIPLPFVIEGNIRKGLLLYMKEYLESFPTERVALFSVGDLSYHEKDGEESLNFIARLSPYEAGIRQEVGLKVVFQESDRKYHTRIFIERLEGLLSIWKTANRPFVYELRRQFLNWRSLSVEERESYQRRLPELESIKGNRIED